MNPLQIKRGPLNIAVVLSLLALLTFTWIRGGIAATPGDTRDSQGRTMGFNDVFSAEHYGILLKQANWHSALRQLNGDDSFWNAEGLQNWGLVAAHFVLLAMLSRAQPRTIRRFLYLQPFLFFLGWIGFWFLPLAILDLVWARTSDREGFIDIPYIAITSQGAWFLACGFIFWQLRPSRSRHHGG